MKKLLLTVLALAAAAGLRAEEAKSSYTITSDFTYTSRYFFRGVKNQDSALQPSVTFAQGPLTLGVWASQAIRHRDEAWSEGKEIDLFGGYSFALDDKYSLALGGTVYLYPSARKAFSEPKSSYEGSLAFSGPLGPLSSKVTYFHDFKYKSDTFQGDLGYSVPLANDAGSLDVGGYYGYNDIGDGDANLPGTGGYTYKYFGLDASVSLKVSEKATAKLGFHWTDTTGDLGHRDENFWVTLGLTVAL